MAGWETKSTASSFDANEQIKNMMSGRQRTNDYKAFESIAEVGAFAESMEDNGAPDFWSFVKGSREYSIVGIDGTQVETMRASIEEYVSSVQSYLEEAIVTTEDEIANALRGGEAEAAVKAYLDKVKAYITNLVSTLNAFGDKLADVGNAWVQAQSNIGSNVNTSTGAFSEGSAYTSQVQYKGASR